MKKTIFLLMVLVTVLIAGCNEKNLISNISGSWHVQRYLVDGSDRTYWFDTTYPVFKWSFTSNGKFYKTWETRRIGTVYTVDTIRHYDPGSQTMVIDSITSTSAIVPYFFTTNVAGDWLLTNSNKYIETRDSTANTLYQIVDHSSGSLHLFSGNIDYYLTQ